MVVSKFRWLAMRQITGVACLAALAGLTTGWEIQVRSEEPAKEFLDRLREEGMFDLAIKYLEIYEAKGWLPASMKSDVKLEGLMIMQDSLAVARTAKERESRLSALETRCREVYDSAKTHPRRSEAGLRLGNLALERGQRELKKLAETTNQKTIEEHRVAAQTAFKEAESIFRETQKNLTPIINQMAGAKIAANDTEKIALRKQYYGEYRQSEILQGLALKLLATSYPEDAKQYQETLVAAEKKLSEVITKAATSTEIGAKTLSRLYRGDVQALLGKVEEAIESYIPVADMDQEGIFRIWRVQATAAIVRLLSSEKGGKKSDLAIKRGTELLKLMTKNEQANPEWLDLQLAVAQARLANAAILAAKKANDPGVKNERREAREILTAIARRPGEHQTTAKKLLADLGIEVTDPADTKLPNVRNFSEAFAEAKTRIERSENAHTSKELLKNRLSEASAADQPAIRKELETVEENAQRDRQQAVELLQKALKFYRPGDSREDLLTARFYLSYLFIKLEKFWEAAAAADYAGRSSPGTETGLKSCNFALVSYRKLGEQLANDEAMGLRGSLEALAKYMIETWPDADETQQATLTLLQNALNTQRWDDAENYLNFLPKSSARSNATRRDLGYVLWIQYLLSQEAERKAGKETTDGDLSLRDRAERLLKEGWDSLEASALDQRAVEAALALATLYLRTDRRNLADEILDREQIGPIAVVNSKSSPIQDPSVKLEVHRLTLQAKVMSASQSGATLEAAEVEKLVKAMQTAAEGSEKLLTNALLTLAKDLRQQLENVKNPSDQADLAAGIRVLMSQLAEVSDNAGILDWAGTTMWQIGKGLANRPASQAVAKQLNASAVKVFEKMLEGDKKGKGYLESIQRKADDIRLKRALALSEQGEYQKATEGFVEILRANTNQLTAQIEAARNFQRWSKNKDIELLRKAAYGTEPDQRGKNLIWGWGLMSKTLSSQLSKRDDLKDIFFEARLQLAACRRLIASNQPTGPDREKLLNQALDDIRSTYLTYPELGTPESKQEFEKLTKLLQTDLGKPNIGLSEFNLIGK